MKFHRVKVENLNSLYGVQTIDFEEDVRSAPLFLILGPTGAGKSTILDAICLALFGQTPRLSRRTARPDTDIAHIMSIGTAHALAEVEFSTLQADGSRARYLAVWAARRAYDDPEGALQRPERSLYRKLPDGSLRLVVSDHREKYFQPGFDEALQGLSVDDFKRSILLAQGEFAAFLHASDSEKASILERLTSTEQYRRIGERAARKRRLIEERHRALMVRIEEMQILTVPQEEELAAAIAAASAARDAARARVDATTAQVDWLQNLETLEEAVANAQTAEEKARASCDARAVDRERLERDAALTDVEPIWREVERATAALTDADRRLGPLRDELAELTSGEPVRETAVTTAREALDDQLRHAAQLEPELRRAHELRTRLQTAQAHTAEAQVTLDAADSAAADARAHRDSLAPRLTDAEGALADAAQRRATLEFARPLVDALGTLRTRLETGIAPLRERATELSAECDALQAQIDEIARERAAYETEVAASRRERGKWQGQVTRARNRLDAALGEHASAPRAVAALSAALDAATSRAEGLRESRYLLQRIREQEVERDALYTRLDAMKAEIDTLRRDEEQLKMLETAQLTTMRACEDAVRLNERVIALSAYRRDLEPEHPCPLCGSASHPYCESHELDELDARAAEDRRRLEEQLEVARRELRATNEKVQLLAAKFVARTTALQKDEARAVALRESLEADHAAFSRATEKASYSPLEAFRLRNTELLDADLAAATSAAQSARSHLDELEQARQQLEAAEARLAEADSTLASIDERLAGYADRTRQLSQQLQTRQSDLSALRADIDARSDALVAEIAQHLPTDAPPQTVEQALDAANSAREALLAADASLADAQGACDRLRAERAAVDERLVELDAAREAAAARVAERREQGAALQTEILAVLDGRDPEVVQRETQAATEAARRALEAAQQDLNSHRERLSGARARRDELTALREQASTSLEAARAELQATLDRLQITREEVAAHLLTPAVRKQLRAALQRLDLEFTRAADRLRDARLRLEKHNLEPLAAPHQTLGDATLELTEARQELDRVTRELGALDERWARHEETRSRRAQFEEELQTVQRELDVWTSIYNVIGVRDGERFKLFAQSLNLQSLVDNANSRLQRLHQRYELTVARGEGGEPTLSFLVRDKYQANVERPLTTLSGGETFLVSLALALGLADFRRVEMPIETLLLDEGFGALDQDSLHMALTTLHQLHRDGTRQIGIISHVDALKELIDARIVVEPRGHGRSRIRFEFGTEHSTPAFELIHG